MKKAIKSYVSFTRTERAGLVFLCALLIILIIIRVTMPLWIHPATDIEKEKKLVASWETFKRTQSKHTDDTTNGKKKDWLDASDDNETPIASVIDINTVDSATLVRLKGIGPVTAGKIVARRKKIGPFTDINQLNGILPKATFELLKEHLSIGSAVN